MSFSFVFLFLGFSTSSSSKIDALAYDITNYTVKKSLEGISLSYVERTDPGYSFGHPLNDVNNNMYLWTHGFKSSPNNYFPGVNVDKAINCSFPEIGKDQYSFLCGVTNSNSRNDDETYRHEYLPIDLMFRGVHDERLFVYLTMTDANLLMQKRGLPILSQSYESIIGTPIELMVGSNSYEAYIANIILESGTSFKDFSNLLHNFSLISNNLPDELARQECYVFNKYENINRFKINYLEKRYDSKKCRIAFLDPDHLDEEQINKYSYGLNWGFENNKPLYFLIILSVILFLLSCYILWKTKSQIYWKKIMLLICFLVFPYIFLLLFTKVFNIYLFFNLAMLFYAIYFVVLVFMLIVFLIGRKYASANSKIQSY